MFGEVDRLGNESVRTEFVRVLLPVWPRGSYYQVGDGEDAQVLALRPHPASIALGLARPWLWSEATGAARESLPNAIEEVLAATENALATLEKLAARVEPDLQSKALRVLRAVQTTRAATFEPTAWQVEFAAALLDPPARADTKPLLGEAWRIRRVLGLQRCDAAASSALEVPCTQLGRQLTARGVESGISFADARRAATR